MLYITKLYEKKEKHINNNKIIMIKFINLLGLVRKVTISCEFEIFQKTWQVYGFFAIV